MSSYRYEYQAGVSNWSRALGDIQDAWSRRLLWTDMAFREFKGKYRGATFGAFWLTLTTAMTAIGLGVLYGYLFGRPLAEHLPYVTCAILSWGLITGFVNSGCAVFVGNANTFKEFPLPSALFAFKLALSQMIAFSYRSIVLVIMLLIFSKSLTPLALLSVVGFLLLVWIGFWSSLALGVINARYRDFGQLVSAFMTFAFFLTPIFWLPDRLNEYAVYLNFNPFFHMIEVIRGPIMGHDNLALHFGFVAAFAVIAPAIGIFVYGKLSHRLAYWC
ncbi:ABC transporter permease [Marinicaulis aureus]|uniref:ABC transporter permease n=1 Tax=Hyphococcus aureus TaxID=2666033 RepID=A0ABW1KUN2_9PROT